jgi:outer membrane protein TolC
VGEGGTVPIRISPLFDIDNSQAFNPIIDSLDIRLLQIQIAKAEIRANETSFWKRLIPQIHISASFGMHDILFVDPTTFTPYILPRDAYRLSVSVSLNDVFSSSKHTQAVLELEQLRTEESRLMTKHLQSRRDLEQQLLDLQDLATWLEKELSFIQQLLHFNELRFQQGKIEFDALIHSKLELISATKSIMQLRQQEALIRQKLVLGVSQ